MSFLKPKALRPGDRVAVIAPAGPFDRLLFEAGLRLVSERYEAVCDPGIFSKTGYLAGSDQRRAAELTAAMADAQVKAVFCARGGYGSLRLLTRLDWTPQATKPLPKPLIGFSDVTALHCDLQSQYRTSIHGPVLTQLGKLPASDVKALFRMLEDPDYCPQLEGNGWGGGTVEGSLLGGNLSVFSRLVGTPYMPALDGAVLLLEDVGELPYRLDRMWTHLTLAGIFKQVKGIALGTFTRCEDPNASDITSTALLRSLVAETGLPCIADLPIGHGRLNHAVSLGCRVRINGETGRFEALEAAVEVATEFSN